MLGNTGGLVVVSAGRSFGRTVRCSTELPFVSYCLHHNSRWACLLAVRGAKARPQFPVPFPERCKYNRFCSHNLSFPSSELPWTCTRHGKQVKSSSQGHCFVPCATRPAVFPNTATTATAPCPSSGAPKCKYTRRCRTASRATGDRSVSVLCDNFNCPARSAPFQMPMRAGSLAATAANALPSMHGHSGASAGSSAFPVPVRGRSVAPTAASAIWHGQFAGKVARGATNHA